MVFYLAKREAAKATPVRVWGFTSKYNINKLLFYEIFPTPEEAISAEKKIKAGSRKRKIALIESMNPEYKDLALEL